MQSSIFKSLGIFLWCFGFFSSYVSVWLVCSSLFERMVTKCCSSDLSFVLLQRVTFPPKICDLSHILSLSHLSHAFSVSPDLSCAWCAGCSSYPLFVDAAMPAKRFVYRFTTCWWGEGFVEGSWFVRYETRGLPPTPPPHAPIFPTYGFRFGFGSLAATLERGRGS